MFTSQLFQELLENIPDNQYIGLGNPNAKILFIGKEAGIDSSIENEHGNPKSWKEKKKDYSEKYIPEKGSNIRNLNHTWQKYQKLYEGILQKLNIDFNKKDKYQITFLENVFTTELSNLNALTTNEAKKREGFRENLKQRKDIFFKTEFIKNFPIKVIFASDKKYIETYRGEVCELFGVKFDRVFDEKSKFKMWIHSETENDKSPKLLIHTRQLTNGAPLKLIDDISDVIAEFIKRNSMDIRVQNLFL